MLRLISSLSKQQQNLVVLQGKQLQKVAALFSSKQEGEEEEEEFKKPRTKKFRKEGEEEDSERSEISYGDEEEGDSRKRGGKKPFSREPRQLRTSQESGEEYEPIAFGTNYEESIEYYNKQLENLEKHMPLNIFSCLNLNEQQEKAMKYLLQDDEQRNIRSKITTLFKKLQENGINEEIVTGIEEAIQTANYKEQSFFINERDFKTLLFSRDFIRIIPQFYSKRFFTANQSFLAQTDIVQIFKRCKQDSDFYALFELLKYHKNFSVKNSNLVQKFTSADKEVVQQFIYDIRSDSNNKLNYLLVFFAAHNLVRINLSSLLEAGEISKHFSKIHFGQLNEKAKQDFSSRLHELLNLKIKLGISTSLQHYLCDNFFSFETYDVALSSISYHILILARLAENHTNLNDLFSQYIQTFSQHKFDFYIKDNLPQILQTLQNKTYYNNLQDALKLFNQQSQKQSSQSTSSSSSSKAIEFQRLTFFDHAFAVKNGVICYNYDLTSQTENIPYRYENGNVLNVDFKQSFASSKLNQYQDTYLQNQREAIVENLLKESTFNSDIATAARKKQTELESLKKTNPTAYYNQMFTFVYNQLDENYDNEDPSIRHYFKSRNINIPASSINHITKNEFCTTNKKADDDLEDDINSTSQQNQIESEVKASKAFSDFMAKVREIDRVSEKTNPFVTKDDIQKMKNLQKEEDKAHEAASQTATPIADPKEVKEVSPTTTKGNNQTFFQDFFGNLTEVEEGVERLEKELYDQRSSYHAIINGLITMPTNFAHSYPEGKYMLYKAFTTPQLYKKNPDFANVLTNANLSDNRTVIHTKTLRLGDIQRDYKQYLEESVFGKALEYPGYNALLDVCSVHYKRKFFKRILTHIVVYRAKLDKSTIENIVKICKENKLGITLFEFTYLLVNDPQSQITQQQLIQLLNSLKTFEEVHEDIETLVRVYLSAQLSRKFENKIIESYINSLVRAKNMNKLMSMLERFRDFFLARKVPFDETISSEANNALSEKFKQEQKDIIQSLFRLYMQKLTSTGLNHYARPLFQELTNMKYALNEADYIQGFKSMDDKPEDIVQLYDQLIEQKVEFNVDLIRCLLEVFKKHPKPLAQLTIKILNEQIYNDKINIEVSDVNDFAFLFSKNEIPSDFSDLLKYLLKNPHKVNDYTKLTSYRIVNSISEEMLKSFMKGQVESLFSSQKQEQIRQQLLQDRMKKRNTKKQAFEAVAVQQPAQQQKQQQQQQSTTDAATAATKPAGEETEKVKVKKVFQLANGRELEFEESADAVNQEEFSEKILTKLTERKIIEKDAKRKVLKKAGVSKFKDIENYIKDLKSQREEK